MARGRKPRKTELQCVIDGFKSISKNEYAASMLLAQFIEAVYSQRMTKGEYFRHLANEGAERSTKETAENVMWKSFTWSETAQGHRYWSNIVDQLQK